MVSFQKRKTKRKNKSKISEFYREGKKDVLTVNKLCILRLKVS